MVKVVDSKAYCAGTDDAVVVAVDAGKYCCYCDSGVPYAGADAVDNPKRLNSQWLALVKRMMEEQMLPRISMLH